MPATISCLNTNIIIASAYWYNNLWLLTMNQTCHCLLCLLYIRLSLLTNVFISYFHFISPKNLHRHSMCVYMIKKCIKAYSTLSISFIGIQPKLQWISELNEKLQYMRNNPHDQYAIAACFEAAAWIPWGTTFSPRSL